MKSKSSPINAIWFSMILISISVAAIKGKIPEVNTALFASAKSAVTLALGLIGPMAFWLGLMKVAEVGGLTNIIARALRPVMVKLFPDVPSDHPAMGAIIMNMAANMLGLGNAATPMGIKAMQELSKLSPKKDTATDSMTLFLAINTSSVTILPLGVITIRAAAGADTPASILIPAILATVTSTTVAIIAAKLMAKRNPMVIDASESNYVSESQEPNTIKETALTPPKNPALGIILITIFVGATSFALYSNRADIAALFTDFASAKSSLIGATNWLIPIIVITFLSFGYFKGVPLYETVTEGAKEGFNTAIRIIPFMVAIFVAIGMIRSSGTLELLNSLLHKPLEFIGMPAEALSMALIRPLSGSGAFGIMSEIVNANPNSFVADLVSVMQGSTETTFYVLAVYFGSIGIRNTRHALPVALIADGAGIMAAVFISRIMF